MGASQALPVLEPKGAARFCPLESSRTMLKPLISSSPGLVAHALHALVSQIPSSSEKAAAVPAVRARELARNAALKAAAVSGGFTLPPGPLGLATVLPDLLAVWRIQQQLVADIAAAFGRSHALTSETMIVCLFQHGGAAITGRLLSRLSDNDVVIHRIAHRALQQLLEKIAVRVAQRLMAKSVSRWLPVVGALGAGAYAYYDTTHVATNAVELFSQPLRVEDSGAASDSDEDANAAQIVRRTSDAPRASARTKSPRKKPRTRSTKRRQ